MAPFSSVGASAKPGALQAAPQAEPVACKSTAKRLAVQQAQPCSHVLYKTNDADKPQAICDRNGEVVLAMCKRCRKAEAELDEPTQAAPAADVVRDAWQPIETAPKDGSQVLLWWDGAVREGWCAGAGKSRDGGDWWLTYSLQIAKGRPTHWMPLPPAPEAATKGEDQ